MCIRDSPFVDLKTKPGTNDEVVPIKGDDGTTSLYVARLAMDGLHAVSFAGEMCIRDSIRTVKKISDWKKLTDTDISNTNCMMITEKKFH